MEDTVKVKKIGIAILIQLFVKQDIFKYVMTMWPVIFILLGIEILYYSYKKDIEIKYDVLGILFTFLLIIFGSIFSIINLGIIKITENEFFLSSAPEQVYKYKFYVENIDLKVLNMSDEKINLTIKEEENLDATYVEIKSITKEDAINNLKELTEDRSVYNFISIENNDDNMIKIFNYPYWVERLDITVYTNKKDKIKCDGNIKIN